VLHRDSCCLMAWSFDLARKSWERHRWKTRVESVAWARIADGSGLLESTLMGLRFFGHGMEF
jgi:hypothetical protein